MDPTKSSGVKRPINCEKVIQQSSSKQPQIASSSSVIGVAFHAEGNARVTIKNVNVNVEHQQPTSQQAPLGIEFQVADPVETFRGREQTFHEVKHAFEEQKDKPCNLVAVCGYGGMGKTQFARMYIKRHRNELQNIIWIFAESKATMSDSFKQLRNKLTEGEVTEADRTSSDRTAADWKSADWTSPERDKTRQD